MSWFGVYAYQGLQVVRARYGERVYAFLLRFGKSRRSTHSEKARLSEVGSLVGLNSSEVEDASSRSIDPQSFPFWLKVILVAVAIYAGYMIVWWATYQPGTLYASIKPNDFLSNSLESTLII